MLAARYQDEDHHIKAVLEYNNNTADSSNLSSRDSLSTPTVQQLGVAAGGAPDDGVLTKASPQLDGLLFTDAQRQQALLGLPVGVLSPAPAVKEQVTSCFEHLSQSWQ